MESVEKDADGRYQCPAQGCTHRAALLDSLRRHCARQHQVKVTVKRPGASSAEHRERQREYSARRRQRQRTLRALARRDVLTVSDADTVRVHGHSQCPVVYRQSTIPQAGNGVFAAIDLRPGDIVTWYGGQHVSQEPADKTYAIAVGSGFIDGLKKPRKGHGLGSFVNRESSNLTSKRKNCTLITVTGAKHDVYVEITKAIKAGKELFTTCSRGYRFS